MGPELGHRGADQAPHAGVLGTETGSLLRQ